MNENNKILFISWPNHKSCAIGCFLFLLFLVFSINTQAQYGGNTCEAAHSSPISVAPGSDFNLQNQTLFDKGNDYTSSNTSLLSSFSTEYFNGPDYVYFFTATANGSITVQVNYENTLTFCHSVSLFEAESSYSLGTHISGSYDSRIVYLSPGLLTIGNVSEGTSYYIVVDATSEMIDTIVASQYSLNVFYNPISPPCSNLGFENGNFSNWYGTSGRTQYCYNSNATHANYCPMNYGTNTNQLSIISGGLDPVGGFPCVYEGNYSAMIGDGTNNSSYGGQLITTFEVSSSSAFASLSYAMVVNDGEHQDTNQAFIQIKMFAQDGTPITCGDYLVIAGDESMGFTQVEGLSTISYCPWQTVTTNLSDYIGQNVTIVVTVGDCSLGAHYAYAYLDCSCEPVELVTSGCYPLNLTAPSGFETYLWTPNGETTQTIEDITNGNYCCEMTRNGCTINLCRDVLIIPFEYALTTVNSDCSGRDNGSIRVDVTGVPNFSYSFSDGSMLNNSDTTRFEIDSLAAGAYYFELIDGLGCTFVDTVDIINNYEIATSYSVFQNATCFGYSDGSASISTDNFYPPYSYMWPDSSTSSINSELIAGTHIVTVTDITGCTSSIPVEITEPQRLTATEINLTHRYGCPPTEIGFSIVDNPSGYTFIWDFTDGENTYQSFEYNPYITFTQGGNYNLTLYYEDQNSCSDSIVFSNLVRIFPNPVASFFADPQRMDSYVPICNFTNESVGASYYFWNFGDGSTSTIESPVYQYNTPGTYWVELVTISDKGCSDSTGLFVYVNDIYTFYAPNAFTPGFDGNNDFFRVFGTGINNGTFYLYVYDRWGEVIFESPDIEQGWDGTVKDRFTQAPIGTYTWLVNFEDVLGRRYEYSGIVNLIR